MTCKKCNGTGWYCYDPDPVYPHSTICDVCCTHSQGWWELTEHYVGYKEGEDNRCCKAGCGTMRRDLHD